jgi:hypothetical protein
MGLCEKSNLHFSIAPIRSKLKRVIFLFGLYESRLEILRPLRFLFALFTVKFSLELNRKERKEKTQRTQRI